MACQVREVVAAAHRPSPVGGAEEVGEPRLDCRAAAFQVTEEVVVVRRTLREAAVEEEEEEEVGTGWKVGPGAHSFQGVEEEEEEVEVEEEGHPVASEWMRRVRPTSLHPDDAVPSAPPYSLWRAARPLRGDPRSTCFWRTSAAALSSHRTPSESPGPAVWLGW